MQFRQSIYEFPLNVSMGKKLPFFGLNRFKQGLRFIPSDDESFILRGDKRRLLYKGRRRSHRFTILGDKAFEYDCILEREPESNVISLLMEGAENFDFFRQPDFVPDDYLKGSYAVYKKETMIGEGTGKLCHIHRPQIIDARRRRCWGELFVIGNELRITVPEWFLSNAKYPVVVDPTIGTDIIGSNYLWDYGAGENWEQLMFGLAVAVNRFLVTETINGDCTAYMYAYVDNFGENGGRPILYSDNNDTPLNRLSMNEGFADFTVNGSKPASWRSATFKSNGAISAGTYIWFGVFADLFWETRFDYGAKCYFSEWIYLGYEVPDTFPLFFGVDWFFDIKPSMYFTYTVPQNYVRTITQGVKLTDTRALSCNLKRSIAQAAGVFTEGKRIFNAVRKAQDALNVTESQSVSIMFLRTINDPVRITDFFRHFGAFIRDLRENAGSGTETSHNAEYKRFAVDTVQAHGVGLRSLFMLVRIVSSVFIRDYILRRFLKAREELVLKSPICLELTLESWID